MTLLDYHQATIERGQHDRRRPPVDATRTWEDELEEILTGHLAELDVYGTLHADSP